MARGASGRIVIEIDPEVKSRLYAVLAKSEMTLKEWFLGCAERFIDQQTQLSLPIEDTQVAEPRSPYNIRKPKDHT